MHCVLFLLKIELYFSNILLFKIFTLSTLDNGILEFKHVRLAVYTGFFFSEFASMLCICLKLADIIDMQTSNQYLRARLKP